LVLAIVGPTASGKSALGMQLTSNLSVPGEILCCDSMQVYRGMDVGTGKPTAADRAEVPHHILDLVAPDQPFHAAAWAAAARVAIEDVWARGRLPIIVGGTGLYLRALVRGLYEAPPSDPAIRARLKGRAVVEGVPALHRELAAIDPATAAGILPNDLVRVGRALEVFEQTGLTVSELKRAAAPPAPLRLFTIVLDPDLVALRCRNGARVDAMVAAGFLDEVARLRAAGYGQTRALQGLGYRQLGAHLDGALSLGDAVAETKRVTVAYARRQRTWFRKEEAAVRIVAEPDSEAVRAVSEKWLVKQQIQQDP
jgi:tRNA dimethylallyltransferase